VILPWPPSVNSYWRTYQGRMIISREGREFRKKVMGLRPPQFGSQRLSVRVLAYPPDRRRRDLDNLLKALCDSLCHAGAYDDDSQIDEIVIRRMDELGGFVDVTIEGI
jgi:crossover junction endodeoxyribonuclease RusA